MYCGYQLSVPGVERPERGINHPPPYRAELELDRAMTVLHICATLGMLWDSLPLSGKNKLD